MSTNDPTGMTATNPKLTVSVIPAALIGQLDRGTTWASARSSARVRSASQMELTLKMM